MNKIRIAVLFGGCSEEHDISVKSAGEIAASLDHNKYTPFFIGITKTGEWKLCNTPCPDWEETNCLPAILSPDRSTHGILVFNQGSYHTIPVDILFPVLHGKTGEDGAIQGLFELSGIPYVGCDITSSALCMDKSLAYLAVRSFGITTPCFLTCSSDELPKSLPFPYPFFVKPARSGSSFGVSRVSTSAELSDALKIAFKYDSKILIEEAVEGVEIGCAILGSGGDLTVGEPDQISLSHGFFRIHQEKAPEKGSENSKILVPAAISPEQKQRIKETARTVYRALGCRGLSRVDMFLKENGEVVLNEVNTLPGCTVYSRYPRMMAAAGITMAEVIDRTIEIALKGV